MTQEILPIRILFVFAWLVVGGEETEVRLLAPGSGLTWQP